MKTAGTTNSTTATTETDPLVSEIRSAASSQDPFDLSRITMSSETGASSGVKKLLTTIPVQKPDKFSWVRVHPDPAFHAIGAAVIINKVDNETFVVASPLHDALGAYITRVALFTSITRQGILFVWPVKLPDSDGKIDRWSESALEGAQLGMKDWTKLVSNRALGAYDLYSAPGELGEPNWPTDLSFKEILRIAFKGKLIESMDDVHVRRLLGQA